MEKNLSDADQWFSNLVIRLENKEIFNYFLNIKDIRPLSVRDI